MEYLLPFFYILFVEFCQHVIVYHEDSSDADFHLKVRWTFLHCLNYSQTFNAYTILYSMLYKKYKVFKYILLLASWLLHNFLHLINNSDGPLRARGLTLILIILWVVSWKPPYTGWWDRMHRRHLITMVQLSSREFSWVYESAASEETQESPVVACAHNFIRPTGILLFF